MSPVCVCLYFFRSLIVISRVNPSIEDFNISDLNTLS